MTVPPNYGPPPEQPQTPGYGHQSPYNGGQNPYGSQPQQPPYGGGAQQPPYGQDPGSPYGGPILPPDPPKRNLGLIGGIIVGVTVLVLGGALLVTMNLRDDGGDSADAAETSEEASEDASTPEDAASNTPEEDTVASEVGQCLPYEPVIADDGYGDGLELVDCSDATAFWEITAQSYDVADVPVDDEGNLTDFTAAKELCGADWAVLQLGKLWTNWHYVYSSGTLDSLYCIKATGATDPSEPDHQPYTPDAGDCFYDSDEWWTVDCSSALAKYKVVDTIVLDEPVAMTEDEAASQATCGGDWYWQVTDPEGRTSSLICGNEL